MMFTSNTTGCNPIDESRGWCRSLSANGTEEEEAKEDGEGQTGEGGGGRVGAMTV